ncbi:MAG TPA: peptidylprolyl isomerase [Pirellulales bacterium]|jgi:parvulin-like peptidyl-prolyl isomerase|nr:peptidylprolyl isomerase [Pirellulales bacterium]
MTRSAATDGSGRKLRVRLLSLAGAAATVGLALLIRNAWQTPSAKAEFPLKRLAANTKSKKTERPAAEGAAVEAVVQPQQLAVMALVNGEKIERAELAREALRHFGEEVLESIINKRLISAECTRRNIAVTQPEVKEEMDRMAQRFGMPTDQLLTMLREERHITPEQYAKEIIWPTVALRKLAGNRLRVSEKDFKEAFDMLYGEAVQARLIACATAREAEKLRAQALANPEEFGNLAKQHSIDTVSASAKGLIQPIHHHQGDANIERVAFALKKDEISEVIEVGDQFVILKCEARLAPQPVERKKVEKVLIESIRDKKLRLEADTIFKELQDAAQIENVMNDPAKSKKQPGVAAIVDGETITVRQVAEECIERHGIEMLDGLISRHLLQQALKKRKLQITEADMEAEIARAAVTMGKTTNDDEPDVEAWLKDVVENQKMSLELYRDDVVWPSVGLRKLAGEDVKVTKEDLQRSFEANYGPRVRCRAIVLANQRDAQKVWDMARKNPTVENFAELAKRYTVEPGGKVNEGEIPPIQKHGGEEILEKEAFSLKKDEISGIVQAGDKWVILFCEGYTKPLNVKLKDVEKIMSDDIRDKKMRLAMAQQYSKLQDEARIENFLSGTVQAGTKAPRQGDLITVPEGTLLAPDNPEPDSKGADNSSRPARPKTATGPSPRSRQ